MKIQKRLFFVCCICGFLIFSPAAFCQQQKAVYAATCPHSNAFYEYLPQGYPATGVRYPVMLFFHGSGEAGPGTPETLPTVLRNGPPKLINEGSFPSSFTVGGKTYSFIVISPQFTEWPNAIDVQAEIDYVVAHYNVDINRIYLTGLSMGGGVVWDYVGSDLNRGNQIAAIVPTCGAQYPYPSYCNTIAEENLPVWATANSMDNTVPPSYTIDHVNLINSAPVPPAIMAKMSIFPVSTPTHDSWTHTYDPAFKEGGVNVYEWMLQYHRNFTVLPVAGLEFSVLGDNAAQNIRLQWKTYAAINITGFTVLRSADGSSFTPIGFVDGAGTTTGSAAYTFTDVSPLKGKNYYRLEIKDKDGSNTYSDIKLGQLENTGAGITIYPVPAANLINIKSAQLFDKAVAYIYNTQGQVVVKKELGGAGNFSLDIAGLPAGAYYLEINNNGQKQQFRFVKK